MKLKIFFILVFISSNASLSFANENWNWIEANGGHCESVCENKNLSPVWSGFHSGNIREKLYVCATNSHDGRPGMNVLTWSNKCIVAHGKDTSITSSSYRCLCINP